MKKLMLVLAAIPMFLGAETSTPKGFTDNLDEAMVAAKKDGRFLYVCFSGSDWCGWCKKLEKEVFSAGDFAGQLKKDYVCVFIDSPNNKKLLSAHAKMNNRKLTKKYEIEGFPTALIIDPKDGEVVESTGYRKGGTADYVKFLLEVRKNPAVRKAAFRDRKAKENLEKKQRDAERKVKIPLIKKHLVPVTAKRQEALTRLQTLFEKELEKAKKTGVEGQALYMAAQKAVAPEFPALTLVLEDTLKQLKGLKVPEKIKSDLEREIKMTEGMIRFFGRKPQAEKPAAPAKK